MKNLHVIWRRNPCGAVASLEIWNGIPENEASEMLLDTYASDNPDIALESIIKNARDYYDCDPFSDKLPPNCAIIEMFLEDLN
jgi:hypothetical protein